MPTLVISPYARGGYVDHTTYNFASLLRLVEVRFGLPALSTLDARTTALLGSFNFAAAPAAPLLLPSHPCPIIPDVRISGAEQGGAGRVSSNVITLRDAPVIAGVAARGAEVLVTVRTAAGRQTYAITAATRVLGRSGRFLDRLALRTGDILLRQGSMVQDESADAATVSGRVAQVEAERRLVVLQVPTTLPGSAALGIPHPQTRSDVVLVLLTPATRVVLPRGQGLADLEPGQMVQATGTLNWRTHTLLRPISLAVQVATHVRSCTRLPVSGRENCNDEQANG